MKNKTLFGYALTYLAFLYGPVLVLPGHQSVVLPA